MFFQNHWKISGYPIFQSRRVLKTLFWEALEIATVRTTTSSVVDIKILSHFLTPPPIQYLIEKHWFFSDFPLFARNQNLLPTHHMCLVKLISKESLMSLVNQKNKIWAREFLNSQIQSFDYNKCIFALIFPEKKHPLCDVYGCHLVQFIQKSKIELAVSSAEVYSAQLKLQRTISPLFRKCEKMRNFLLISKR